MIRVVKGNPDDAELAAVTVVLLAAAAATRSTGPSVERAGWRPPQWTLGRGEPWRRSGHAVLSWRRHHPAGKGR
ncbi:acyl-CoA carboxylase epsilon subunit [Labedaea rhizosphaerae]|uniref:Acyl-CoA carboxylase epsilon subunit-like protein n=1 Tax=Labedaea rhizosphaerae TaxID=598644 RepID=A0A4R6RUD8_LABRH|nr:acyl-CoA carboxylase epsilon subunit [Labedaea rhizosphaerae]TDP90579.1 acyl-CoA carboxylase epsilon subunit-like protein [Labedaea rhizosphaerae]